jgi:hypothetical protein
VASAKHRFGHCWSRAGSVVIANLASRSALSAQASRFAHPALCRFVAS